MGRKPLPQRHKWCFSESGENFTGAFDARHLAIRAALAEAVKTQGVASKKELVCPDVWVGWYERTARLSAFVSVDDVLEYAVDSAIDQHSEIAEDWEPRATPEQDAELCALIDAWAERHGLHPAFWIVQEATKVPDEELKDLCLLTP